MDAGVRGGGTGDSLEIAVHAKVVVALCAAVPADGADTLAVRGVSGDGGELVVAAKAGYGGLFCQAYRLVGRNREQEPETGIRGDSVLPTFSPGAGC